MMNPTSQTPAHHKPNTPMMTLNAMSPARPVKSMATRLAARPRVGAYRAITTRGESDMMALRGDPPGGQLVFGSGGRRVAARWRVVIHDQARTPLPGQVHPHPLDEDADPEARLPQELETKSGPGEPGEKPAEAHTAALQHREAPADHGHRPFVEIAEWRGYKCSDDATVNQPAGVPAFLHGHLGHAR